MKEQRATSERPPSRTLPLLTLPVQFHGVHVRPVIDDGLALRASLWSVAATVIVEGVLTKLGAPGTNESNQCAVLETFVPIDMLFASVGVLFGTLAALRAGKDYVALAVGVAMAGIGLYALYLDVTALQTTIQTCG